MPTRRLGSFDLGRPFGPWICRIAANLAINHVRSPEAREEAACPRATPRPAGSAEPGRSAVLEREAPRGPAPRPSRRLPAEQRAVFVLRVHEELSYREIAEALGLSMGTVMSRLSRAREKLREALAPYLGACPAARGRGALSAARRRAALGLPGRRAAGGRAARGTGTPGAVPRLRPAPGGPDRGGRRPARGLSVEAPAGYFESLARPHPAAASGAAAWPGPSLGLGGGGSGPAGGAHPARAARTPRANPATCRGAGVAPIDAPSRRPQQELQEAARPHREGAPRRRRHPPRRSQPRPRSRAGPGRTSRLKARRRANRRAPAGRKVSPRRPLPRLRRQRRPLQPSRTRRPRAAPSATSRPLPRPSPRAWPPPAAWRRPARKQESEPAKTNETRRSQTGPARLRGRRDRPRRPVRCARTGAAGRTFDVRGRCGRRGSPPPGRSRGPGLRALGRSGGSGDPAPRCRGVPVAPRGPPRGPGTRAPAAPPRSR